MSEALISNFTWLIRFPLPLFILEMVFVPFVKKRNFFWLRIIGSSLAFFGLTFLIVHYNLYLSWSWFKTSFIIVFAISLLPFVVSLKTKFKNILFYAMAAYAMQNCLDSVCNIIYILAGKPDSLAIKLTIFILTVLLGSFFYYTFFARRISNKGLETIDNKIFYFTLFMTLAVVYLLSMYTFIGDDNADSISARLFSIVACVLVLFIQFGIYEKNEIKIQNEILEKIIYKENHMYSEANERMELINIKCHDLKHRIKSLRNYAGSKEELQEIDNLEDQIEFFDTTIHSGNEALDEILSQKSLVCKNLKIKYSFIVDGTKLSFMKSLDIYSLFGNAIDNAIDALKKVEEDKRIITINIREKNDKIIVHIENYTSVETTFIDGIPQTTKKHKENHGYGTKSISLITKKYHGNLAFKLDNNIFTLNIIFPKQ
ncbi:MAG: GHKL domain-containing protein [Bacilli bacterium]